MDDFRNPADLIGLNRSSSLTRMMRACGVKETLISGGASHMDQFLALAEIMPLCPGHKEAEAVNRTLREATGLNAPLCPHTARAVWSAWVDRYWYRRDGETVNLPESCPACVIPAPVWVGEEKRALLPDPTAVEGSNLSAWTRAWEAHLESAFHSGDIYFLFSLPEGYVFRRPDPYHAGEVIRKMAAHQPPVPEEVCLLTTQALRVWGQWSLRKDRKDSPPLLLRGGSAETVRALLAYLNSSRALAPLVWIPQDPAEAETVSGLYAAVGTGVYLSSCQTPEERERFIQAYREVAPWGRATVI